MNVEYGESLRRHPRGLRQGDEDLESENRVLCHDVTDLTGREWEVGGGAMTCAEEILHGEMIINYCADTYNCPEYYCHQ